MIPCLNIRKLNQTNTSGKQQIVAFGKDEYKYMLLLVILEKKNELKYILVLEPQSYVPYPSGCEISRMKLMSIGVSIMCNIDISTIILNKTT